MRLLQSSGHDFTLVEFVDRIPPYAILSHTWGADEDEVTFKDIYIAYAKTTAARHRAPGRPWMKKILVFAVNPP
jgi:hypothetical protein